MTKPSVIHIRCPGCAAVRALDGTRCPHCGRCAFCGRKLGENEPRCHCQGASDPDAATESWTGHVIPEDQVARERRRMAIRGQLANKRAVVIALVVVGWLTAASLAYGDLFGDFAWKTFGVYAVCVASPALLLWALIDRVFRKIEDRRLRAKDGPSGETRDGDG